MKEKDFSLPMLFLTLPTLDWSSPCTSSIFHFHSLGYTHTDRNVAPVVQRIERCPSKAKIQVRFLAGVPISSFEILGSGFRYK